MRYVRTLLLSVGIVIAYYLIVTLRNPETLAGDTSGIILFTVLVFVWRLRTDPHRKYFS
ncbi:MAG: hypothetical protein JXM79_15175 [Sedimentisphaerales bacterium]|nr:hypothetical protein [Sedimentisphaerales bacterium]